MQVTIHNLLPLFYWLKMGSVAENMSTISSAILLKLLD